MKTILFDIESDHLLRDITKVHLIVAHCPEEGWTRTIIGSDIEGFLQEMATADVLVAHNAIGFDLPALKKIYGFEFTGQVYDTYILSQMFYANEMQSHSIEAWGDVFRLPKGEITDFSVLTDEMIDYAKRDLEILIKLWGYCEKQFDNWTWAPAIAIEQEHYRVYSEHCTHWYIDTVKLEKGIALLSRYIRLLERRLLQEAPLRIIPGAEYKSRNKDGSIPMRVQKRFAETNESIFNLSGDFCGYDVANINLNSTKQVCDWLLALGWKPDTWNYKTDERNRPVKDAEGNLIVSSPSLSKSEFYGVPAELSHLLKQHSKASTRLSNLEGFKRKIYDGFKIDPFSYTCGTNTGRHRHRLIVNVPKDDDDVFFGRQMRELFIAPEGYVLVGCDAAAIEARIEGHFTYPLDGGEYADFLLKTDIHTFNAASWGVTRSQAKSPYYALSYQCGPAKLATMLQCSEDRAKYIHTKYWEDRPALRQLVDQLETAVVQRGDAKRRGPMVDITSKRAWIKGIDGRKLYVRSAHSLKNTLIQNAGAVIMKLAGNYAAKAIKDQGLDARIVIFYHDEINIIAKDDGVTPGKVKEILENAWTWAGDHLQSRVKIVGEAKIGKDWASCH
jgi:DNA polymerase-1